MNKLTQVLLALTLVTAALLVAPQAQAITLGDRKAAVAANADADKLFWGDVEAAKERDREEYDRFEREGVEGEAKIQEKYSEAQITVVRTDKELKERKKEWKKSGQEDRAHVREASKRRAIATNDRDMGIGYIKRARKKAEQRSTQVRLIDLNNLPTIESTGIPASFAKPYRTTKEYGRNAAKFYIGVPKLNMTQEEISERNTYNLKVQAKLLSDAWAAYNAGAIQRKEAQARMPDVGDIADTASNGMAFNLTRQRGVISSQLATSMNLGKRSRIGGVLNYNDNGTPFYSIHPYVSMKHTDSASTRLMLNLGRLNDTVVGSVGAQFKFSW